MPVSCSLSQGKIEDTKNIKILCSLSSVLKKFNPMEFNLKS